MLFENIKKNLIRLANKTAFVINEKEYSYNFFKKRILVILNYFKQKQIKKSDQIIVYIDDHIDTYASIIAIFFSGATFIPINPSHPDERNKLILSQVTPKLKLSAEIAISESIITATLETKNTELTLNIDKENPAYILFTSGSTGVPKGVEVSYSNISNFVQNFSNLFSKLNEKDRFLQIYDLTFDASLHCYLLPLFIGGSIYTIPNNKIKYLYAYKLMDKHKLTFAKFPPSIITYLSSYLNKINLPELKYSLFGGEGLRVDIVKKWSNCVPNAEIFNVYGPTEATINTHFLKLNDIDLDKKSENGILSIGKTFGSNLSLVIDEYNEKVPDGQPGELCLGGEQIAIGYYNDKEKTKKSFIFKSDKGGKIKFYKTGDLAFKDEEGDFMFLGRIDDQVQIQGFRIELSEIEQIAFKFGHAENYAAVAILNQIGTNEIHLFAQNLTKEISDLEQYLKQNLPSYMYPTKVMNIQRFPQTSSGKIDKNKLAKFIENE